MEHIILFNLLSYFLSLVLDLLHPSWNALGLQKLGRAFQKIKYAKKKLIMLQLKCWN